MCFLGWENIENATANRELSALLDHIDARITQVFKLPGKVGKIDDIPGFDTYGSTVRDPMNDGLHESTNGDNNDIQRPGMFVSRLRVDQTT